MSCCSCGGCGCSACNYIVNLPDDPVAAYLFSNINLNGIGVLNGVTDTVNVNFRGVASANALLTVTLDAGNNAILLTVDSAAIAAALPAATTTQAGVLETATDAEAIAKAATDKIVVPSNFAAMDASTIFKGFIEIATNAEAQAGASALLAITPASLASVTALQKTTTTFADSVARAAAVPAFKGQFGYQLDALMPFSAYGTIAGNWLPMLTFGITNTIGSVATTITYGIGATNTINGTADTYNSSQVDFTASTVNFTGNAALNITGSFFNLDASEFQIGSAPAAANSVICTSAFPGDLTDRALNTFLSSANTDTGWTVANLTPLRALDCAASTLGDLRNIVGTLLSIILDSTPLKPSA